MTTDHSASTRVGIISRRSPSDLVRLKSTPRRQYLVRVAAAFASLMFASLVSGCSQGSDPTIEGLIGDPDAALEFLYPDGVVEPGTSPVAIKYIRDTDWNDDGFDTLTQMLDQAATTYRDPTNPKSELSALAATDTINLLGQRDNLPNTGNDNLGHLLANYIIDIDSDVNTTTAATLAQLGPTFEGLPPSAEFNPDALDAVITKAMKSPDAISQITNATLQLNANRTAAAVQNDAEVSVVRVGIAENNELVHYVIERAGLERQSKPSDRTRAMITELRNAQNLLPAPDQRFTNFLQGQDITKNRPTPLEPFVDESVFDNPKDLDGPTGIARQSLLIATGVQIGEAGLLTDTDVNDNIYPWAVDGDFDAYVALDDDNAVAFFDALKHDPNWGVAFVELLNRPDTT